MSIPKLLTDNPYRILGVSPMTDSKRIGDFEMGLIVDGYGYAIRIYFSNYKLIKRTRTLQ